ncbi:MAG TPA: hypothetical protein PLD62_03905, partial [Candidatus Cloacimonadota bacterium]|nr:hypothetical protein [Candidatus Cloacimonadota bacterium]
MSINKKNGLVVGSLLLMILILINTITFLSIKHTTIDNELSYLQSIAKYVQTRLRSLDQLNNERLALIGSRTQLRLSLADYLKNPRPEYVDKMNLILVDALNSISDFQEIKIIGLNGKIIASTQKAELGQSFPFSDCLPENRNITKVSKLYLNENLEPALHLCAPLLLYDQILGYVFISSSAQEITNIFTDASFLGETGYVLMVITPSPQKDQYILTPRRINNRFTDYTINSYRQLGSISHHVINKMYGVYEKLNDYKQEPMLVAIESYPSMNAGFSVPVYNHSVSHKR